MNGVRQILAVGLVLTLSACVQYTLVEAGVHRAGIYSLTTPIDWSRSSGPPVLWTVDGPGLEYVLHFEGVRSGAKIFKQMPADAGQAFSAEMRASEVVDVFVESFGLAWGAKAIRLLRLRPAEFGPWPGFAFELEFESANDLAMRAVARGAVIDERLYLIVYAGARDYYYEKYLPEVEATLDSIVRL